MLPMILLILKIIGVILLTVLGLLLTILLVVLLVPVRYQLRASHGEGLYLKGRVSWLLHLVQLSVTHIEGVLHIRARILGFVLYDNLKPPKPKRNKAKRDQTRKKLKPAMDHKESVLSQKQSTERKAPIGNSIKSMDDAEKAEDNNSEGTDTEHSNTENDFTQYSNLEYNNSGVSNSGVSNTENRNTEYSNAEIVNTENSKTIANKIEYRRTEKPSASGEQVSIFNKLYHRLRDIPEKWKVAYHKVRNKLQAIRDSIRNKFEKLKDIITKIRHKWRLIYDFWLDELNKQGMKYTWHIIKKLLKHILPTKLKSELIIGTGDPYSTGQVLSVISFFYGFYGDKVSVIPDFENSRFEGKHYARGRIRAATILIIVCRLLLDKRFKYLKNNFLILKEAL